MKDTIPVPKAWLERLISLSESILGTSQPVKDEGKNLLKGYIETAKLLIGQEKCKNCGILKPGSIMYLDKDGKCIDCGKMVSELKLIKTPKGTAPVLK